MVIKILLAVALVGFLVFQVVSLVTTIRSKRAAAKVKESADLPPEQSATPDDEFVKKS